MEHLQMNKQKKQIVDRACENLIAIADNPDRLWRALAELDLDELKRIEDGTGDIVCALVLQPEEPMSSCDPSN
jgi:hypothetical protein